MRLLIIGSTIFEIKPLLIFLQDFNDYFNKNFIPEIQITGVGMMHTTYHLHKKISVCRPDVVLQVGIAGSFSDKIKIGDVVLVKKDCVSDLGVMDKNNFVSAFDMELMKPNIYPYTKGWLVNDNEEILQNIRVKKVNGVTVNEITTNISRINFLKQKYSLSVETMEGAALHYVCLMEKIPFVQLRGISNFVGDRNKKNWNFTDAIINVNNTAIDYLKTILCN